MVPSPNLQFDKEKTMDWHKYEKQAANEGFKTICGVDEAGRGPLAGPVFAAAVILPRQCTIDGLNDSKKLSEKKRNKLYDIIKQVAISYKIVAINEKEIDRINILQATLKAMELSIYGLNPKPDIALIDGNVAPKITIESKTIIKGDSVCASIAAASILAKVSRDEFMKKVSEKYPDYFFEKHKGYGTKLHRELILEHGPCEIHRKTFLKKIIK
jgi:ribonuclease HII